MMSPVADRNFPRVGRINPEVAAGTFGIGREKTGLFRK
jgi:hypothetical protein